MDSHTGCQTQIRVYREKTDEELVSISPRDGEAFSELVFRYRAVAFKAAFCVLRNAVEAEDQVQTAFCKAYQHLGAFRQTAKFSTWLVRIVVNECLMQLRHTRRAKTVSLEGLQTEHSHFQVRDTGRSAQEAAEHEALGKLLEREIGRIPPLLRHAFVLRDVQQRPMPDVAKHLGISVHAAKSRLSRARSELRKRLEPHVGSGMQIRWRN